MYAFVSNEFRTIVYTQRRLNFLCNVYTYPQFKKVETEQEAKQFFVSCNRDFLSSGLSKYGRNNEVGYVSVEYFIDGNNIYANVFTKHFGFIKLSNLPDNVIQDASYDLLKLKIKGVHLDDMLIGNHCIALQRLLGLFDECINIEFVLPDISIYLACTKYTGKNYSITRLQDVIRSRPGSVFYTVK
ncbi:MAG: hypothetical protein IKL53_02300 [Lachnospiraceae bacterium]|nr:hypothetical protein [Lachnospiraceae bacterium]